MSAKNPVGDKATAVVADDWKETLKRVGGSQSDDWNHVLGNQAIQSLWIKQSDNEVRARQYNAAITGLIGIAPQDEIEGMIAAELIAAHNATMECYRRAMIDEQTLEGRRDNRSQANKLSRTYPVLLDALNRYRGKEGQQIKSWSSTSTCMPAGRRWSAWSRAQGEGINRNQRINPMQNKLPMHLSRRCGARKWLSMSDCNRK